MILVLGLKLVLDDLEYEEVLLIEGVVIEMEIYLVWIIHFSELLNVHQSFPSLLRMCTFSESSVLLPRGLILIMDLLLSFATWMQNWIPASHWILVPSNGLFTVEYMITRMCHCGIINRSIS